MHSYDEKLNLLVVVILISEVDGKSVTWELSLYFLCDEARAQSDETCSELYCLS